MYKVIDLFCGCGGFARGFMEGGFEMLLGIDIDVNSLNTYSSNIKGTITWRTDLRDVHSQYITNIIGSSPDVIIGSPPCEPFTPVNNKRMKDELDRLYIDEMGRLTLHFIRIVGDLKPKIFVMENVPQIVEGELKWALKWEFNKVGYKRIYFNILRAEDSQTPSIRRRIFISNIPIKIKRESKRVNVEEALRGLPDPEEIIGYPNHEITPLTEKKIKKIAKLRWGDGLILFKGANGKIYRNMIRLHPKRLAPTVMGGSRFIHPYENRLLTVREQARLMGFPDTHIFYGSREEQYNQIGEAVPPTLSRAIAKQIKRVLDEGW
jgi:DNA (cytosine-5)-methyltransferase 1